MHAPPALHPTDQTLLAYGLGKLDDSDAEAVDLHLENCPECQRRVAQSSSDSFLQRLRDARDREVATREAWRESGAADTPATPGRGVPPELAGHPLYEVVRELGRGGMGVVYLARNRLMDRPEVLKVLNPLLIGRCGTLDRFLREIRSAARLSHPNVIAAYNALQIGALVVLAMEYVEGDDLARLVDERGPLPVPQACDFARQAALGLQHAHGRGMVHRDIKPGNLILARDGDRAVVKVLDFGLAKLANEDRPGGALTGEGQMIGTPDYIAPEQTLDAQKADIRADIYSLGCTLYYLLTGAPPFPGASLYEVLQAHHSMEARPLNLVRPEVSPGLAAVVGKMMAKDPAHRFATPTDVARALLPFCEGGRRSAAPDEVEAKPTAMTSPRGRGRRRLAAATTAAALLLGMGASWALGVFSLRTKDGTIVIEGLTDDAELAVDGQTVRFRLAGGAASFEVGRAPGRHGVVVRRDGFQVFGDEVLVEPGGRTPVSVRFVPLPRPRHPDRRAFTAVAGDWSVDGDELVQSSLDSGLGRPLLLFGEQDWSDYDLTLEALKVRGAEGFAVVFHWRSPANCRDFGVGKYGNRGHDLSGVDAGRWNRLEGNYLPGHIESGRWYAVKVEVRGAVQRCYLDGDLLFESTDGRVTRGRAGFATWATAVRFRKIRVSAPDGTPLWVGPPAGGPARSKAPAPVPPRHVATPDGFRPLFNGRDLDGWKAVPGGWTVEDGVIVSGDRRSELVSTRNDFENFHLRVEAMINPEGNSGVIVRARPGRWGADGYEAEITFNPRLLARTGSLTGFGEQALVTRNLARPGDWFRQEVIADGDRIAIKLNGETTVDLRDPARKYARGGLAIQQFDPQTRVRIRSIEIKELPPSPAPADPDPRPPANRG